MRCEIVYDFLSQQHKVFFFEHRRDRTTVLFVPRGGRLWEERVSDEGTCFDVEGSFSLTPEMLDAIVKATRNSKLPSEATQDQLEDAMRIRDRLLALVERSSTESGINNRRNDHTP